MTVSSPLKTVYYLIDILTHNFLFFEGVDVSSSDSLNTKS